MKWTIGFVGAGRMATALAVGMAKTGLVSEQLYFLDPGDQAATTFENSLTSAIRCRDENELVEQAEVVFLAVKPQVYPEVMPKLKACWKAERLLVSVMAGITSKTMVAGLGSKRVVRTMPNTPCLIGRGAVAIAKPDAEAVQAEELDLLTDLFKSVGVVHAIQEHLLDAVTGVSGSGPAYVYLFIEALVEAGVRQGLPRAVAESLALETVLGSAQMVKDTGEHPAILKEAVTSPGGTTAAALYQLEAGAIRSLVSDAVEAAVVRAKLMAGQS